MRAPEEVPGDSVRLIDLDPRWYVLETGGPSVGLTFECPHCHSVRLGIAFHHRGHDEWKEIFQIAFRMSSG